MFLRFSLLVSICFTGGFPLATAAPPNIVLMTTHCRPAGRQ